MKYIDFTTHTHTNQTHGFPLVCTHYHQRATLWCLRTIGTQWAARSARSVWWAEQREEDRDGGVEAECVWERINTKQKVRRDN